MIDEKLLLEYGASVKEYGKDQTIFFRDEAAIYYFQVLSGEVKMNNYSDDGKEFIQNIFSSGEGFGEPPLFGNFNYPANATVIKEAKIIRLEKAYFFKLLQSNPELHFEFTKVLANRLYYKALMATELSSEKPEHRILTLIDYLKHDVHHLDKSDEFKVELTRQQIADLTGIRVETVIRSIKKLEEIGELKIFKRLVYR